MTSRLVKLAAGLWVAHTIRDLQLEREHLQSKLWVERQHHYRMAHKAAEQRVRAERAEAQVRKLQPLSRLPFNTGQFR